VVGDATVVGKRVSREETSRFLKFQCGRSPDEAVNNLKLKIRLELLCDRHSHVLVRSFLNARRLEHFRDAGDRARDFPACATRDGVLRSAWVRNRGFPLMLFCVVRGSFFF